MQGKNEVQDGSTSSDENTKQDSYKTTHIQKERNNLSKAR